MAKIFSILFLVIFLGLLIAFFIWFFRGLNRVANRKKLARHGDTAPESLGDQLKKVSKPAKPRYATKQERRARAEKMSRQSEELTALFGEVVQMYSGRACPCAFPRFQQLVAINCSHTGDSYRCYDTELLISAVKEGFAITDSERSDEANNKLWTCRHCGSVYEFGWSDFSIAVDRSKLELVDLHAPAIGKAARTPVPVYIGAMGHSLPGDSELEIVELEVFRRYMLETD